MKLKSCNVTNTDNVLLQIPKLIVELWGLKKGDKLSMELDRDNKVIIIKKED